MSKTFDDHFAEVPDNMDDVSKWTACPCPTCGQAAEMRWTGLRTVAATGDENHHEIKASDFGPEGFPIKPAGHDDLKAAQDSTWPFRAGNIHTGPEYAADRSRLVSAAIMVAHPDRGGTDARIARVVKLRARLEALVGG